MAEAPQRDWHADSPNLVLAAPDAGGWEVRHLSCWECDLQWRLGVLLGLCRAGATPRTRGLAKGSIKPASIITDDAAAASALIGRVALLTCRT